MQSSLIGQIEKAKYYAQEKGRATFTSFAVNFEGKNSTHTVTYENGQWHCSCRSFRSHGTCSHSMALQQMLGDMLPEDTLPDGATASEVAASA